MLALLTSPITLSLVGYRSLSQYFYTRIRNPFYHIRALSTLHAATTFIWSALYLGLGLSDTTFGWVLTLLSSGFFILDIGHMVLYRDRYSTEAKLSYLAHHSMCLVCTGYHPQYSYEIARGYLSELSTPFMNLSWRWRRENRIGPAYFLNGLWIIGLFWQTRIVNFVDLLRTRWEVTNGSVHVMGVAFLFLNIMWTYKVVESFWKDYRTWKQGKRIHA